MTASSLRSTGFQPVFIFFLLCLMPLANAYADGPAKPKPVPLMQAIPEPYDQISFQRDGQEIARYHFGAALRRPFVFPMIGPSGRSLSRMGHPHDPESHSHHNSVWIAHHDVNGISFWGDHEKGRIIHRRIEAFDDGDDHAWVQTLNEWVNEADRKVLMQEHRRTQVRPLDNGQWLLLIDLQFESKERVTFGKTPFGLVGVRMAKSIGTNDGGGEIRNSEGGVNEKEIFWKRAKWVDYSGPITNKAIEGMTLMDHPTNPNHPSVFHVRADGWMGSSLTEDAPRMLESGKPLRLRYGIYVHRGQPDVKALDRAWEEFASLALDDLAIKRR